MEKAYKFRIYPTEQQKELMLKTFGCVRFVYNQTLAARWDVYDKPRGSAMTGKRIRGVSRSWKDNPGRTRNWQRDTTGHMPAKVSLPLDIAALSEELIGA